MLEFIFGDHYKELGRRRVFGRKKYFYEFLGLIFIILLTVTSLSYAEEDKVNIDGKDFTKALDCICIISGYNKDLYLEIKRKLEEKNILLNCPYVLGV